MQNINFGSLGKTPTIVRASEIAVDLTSTPLKYHRHGWQSWSLAAWTKLNPMLLQQPAIFHPLQVDVEYVREKNHNGSWFGALEFEDGNILLLGALALGAHVFFAGTQLTGRFESGEGEWFAAYGRENAVFEEYAQKLADRFGRKKTGAAPRVWCSWYSLYHAIDETALFNTFEKLGDLPFDVLQVDDGWQRSIGDWEPNAKFPSGMDALAARIKSTGRMAGLWLAPLIATRSSRLFHKHPDWFLRDARGRHVSAGFGWGQQLYALDTTQPEAIDWLGTLMKQVRAWGFDYLKLDFLYAGALKGIRSADIAREAAYRDALELMRGAMGSDAFFLGCGTPIIPALGLCDAIRIGPDVAHQWEKYRDAVLLYNHTTPGTRNAIRTVMNRLWLKQIIQIDPDVVYFGERENEMTHAQKSLLQDLALVCQFKATSDLPQWMTTAELGQLRQFLEADPKIEQMGRYVFQLDHRVVDFSAAVELPEAPMGIVAAWGAFLGWLGSLPFVLRIINRIDDEVLRKRRASI